jgi:hypothetical protein
VDLLTTIQREWAVIRPAIWALVGVIIVIGGAIWIAVHFLYRNQLENKQAIIDRQNSELEEYRQKEAITATTAGQTQAKQEPESKLPEFHLLLDGGNIFIPDQAKELTGISLDARIWNLGKPSIVTAWSLTILPKDLMPIRAQFTKIPAELLIGGANSTVIRASGSLADKTSKDTVGTDLVSGVLLFYVKLSKKTVVRPDTWLELSAKDLYGNEFTARQRMGDWLSR